VNDPTDDEPTLLALSQAEAVSATCYDGLLTIPPAVLTPAERADLDAARVRVSRLYCSLASRRGERRVELHGPPGPAVRGPAP